MKQGELWPETEYISTPKPYAPEIWQYTWEECLQLYRQGKALVSWEGYLIAGRDRKLDPANKGRAHEMYMHTLEKALQAGEKVPAHVKQAAGLT